MSITVKIQVPAKAPIKNATRALEVDSFEVVAGGTLRLVRSEDGVVEYLPRGAWLAAEHAPFPSGSNDGTSTAAYSFP